MGIWLMLAGAVVSAPLWVILTLWFSRRVWHGARRLSARARGRQQLAELGQLAAGLAHEIKNPLSTINLNLKLLAEDLSRFTNDDHSRWRRRLLSVQQEANRLKEILEDFLRYAGKYELQLALVDLRRLVGELADFFGPQAQAAHVILRTALPDQPVRCMVDANLIKQALLNLLINAIQAMGAGGGELLIRLASQRGTAIIEVIDTGGGIDPKVLRNIFEVYFSTKKTGTGLGLPTSRRILREHEGDITVQSELGKGTRFVITLPLPKNPEVRKD